MATAISKKRHSCLFGLPLALTHYVVDNETLSERAGLFSVTAKAVSLSQVCNMVVTQSTWQKWWGLSTVRVATTDPAIPEFVVCNIRDGEAFAAALQKTIDATQGLRQTATE